MSAPPPWRRLVAEARRLASPGGRAELGLCAAEGWRPVERAVRLGWGVRALLVGEQRLAEADARLAALLDELSLRGPLPTPVPDEELTRLTEGRDEGGVVALVERGPQPELAELAARARTLLVAVDLHDPGNAGALVRTAHALGADGFVSAGGTDPFHPRAIRISRGSVFALPALQLASADEVLAALTRAGARTLGTAVRGGSRPGPETFGPAPRAIFLGSEAHGLAPALVERLDACLSVPMVAGVDSLSIHAAAAALLALLGPAEDDRHPV